MFNRCRDLCRSNLDCVRAVLARSRLAAVVALLAYLFGCAAMLSAAEQSGATVIESARKSCRDLENGYLDRTDKALSRADLNGDGRPDDIVDYCQFECSTAATLFHGTGGCLLSVVVDGKISEFVAKKWKIVDWSGRSILLLSVHGSQCGGTNQRQCYRAVTWSEGAFRTTGEKQ